MVLACTAAPLNAATRLAPPSTVVEEAPHTAITTLPTDVTAMVGRFASGPFESPQRVTSFDEFSRSFGAAGQDAAAVRFFYENGGASLYVVRARQSAPRDVIAALNALAAVPFQMLAVPVTYEMDKEGAAQTIDAAIRLSSDKRAFYFIDVPRNFSRSEVTDFAGSRNTPWAAIYYPALKTPWGTLPPGSAVAGRVAFADRTHGFWKPATEALSAVQGFADGVRAGELSYPVNNVNFFRYASGRGYLFQSHRTLSSDPERRDLPVARAQQIIEQSVRTGLAWVETAPNDQRTWDEAANAVNAYLSGLWRSGALVGETPRNAFFVRCDRTTMSDADLAAGRTVMTIGIAPLKPAEFISRRIVFTRK
jgi:phage tail sheath protein FI